MYSLRDTKHKEHNMIRTLNASAIKAVIRCYKQGMCEGQTARLLGLHIHTVIRLITEYNCAKAKR